MLSVIFISLLAVSGSAAAGQSTSGGRAKDPGSVVLTPPRTETKRYALTVYYDTFTAAHPVALKIQSGDRVATTTVDDTGAGADGQTVAKGHNPQTEPFYIEGAEPGDMIIVSIETLEPNRLSGLSPSFMVANAFDAGALANHDAPRVPWTIDKEKGVVRFDLAAAIRNVDWHQRFISPTIEMPLRPMLGSLGVAAASKDESSAVGSFGGNLMYSGLTAGVRVMLPVYQPGALLYLGRGYARQGDGNSTGAGIEMPMSVEFSVELMKPKQWGHSSIVRPSTAFQDDDLGVSGIQWPRIETNDWLACVGSGPSVIVALQHATSELDHWLDDDFGFSERSVAILLGQGIEYEIANIADPKNVTVVARIKKSYLPTAATVQTVPPQ
jgi:acetamidase/formamidase